MLQTSLVWLVAAMLALSPVPISSSQDFEEQVADQIAAIHEAIAPDYEYASDLLIGEIEAGGSDGFPMEIHGAAEYIIVAVCDADCDDLDMAVYDPDDEQAAADIEYDDYPMIRITGEGEFWVEILMADCQAETCLYGAQVFVRQ